MTANIHKPASKKIPGTKQSLQNSQLLVSSGIPSLDHIIGGGLPLSSIFLIEEDVHGKYANVMFKYFLSEGVLCNHDILLATLDSDSEKLVTELPSPTNADSELLVSERANDNNESMKIAWRYNNLGPIQSSIDSSLQFGHYYDISKPMEKDIIKNASIDHWKLPIHHEKIETVNTAYESLLTYIKAKLSQGYEKIDGQVKENILRIGIQSLGSPYWEKFNSKNSFKCIVKFIYGLRAIMCSTSAVVLLTIPSYLFEDPDLILRIRHSVDGCIKLDSFAGTERENITALRDYHGFFYMPKLISLNTLAPYIPPTLDLAFKLRRKKFLIEKLHLPPELQDSSEREQDDGSNFGCGSAKQRNLEF